MDACVCNGVVVIGVDVKCRVRLMTIVAPVEVEGCRLVSTVNE